MENLETKTKLIKNLTNADLIIKFESLVSLEKKTTAEVLDYLKEIELRKTYLHLGYTSSFSYLTKGLGYSESSALRRINAARILESVPEIKKDLESGNLNLMQVSMVAAGLKQKAKERKEDKVSSSVDKKTLLMKVRNLDMASTQKIIAETLDLEVKHFDKQRVQKDDSVRVELTLTKKQAETIERVKELISHTYPNPSIGDLIDYLASEFLQRKDPLRKNTNQTGQNTTIMVVKNKASKKSLFEDANKNANKNRLRRKHIPIQVQTEIHQRDRCCQWVDPRTKQKCASKFQLQIDHIYPIYKGGTNKVENLQLLCSVHNKMKYTEVIS